MNFQKLEMNKKGKIAGSEELAMKLEETQVGKPHGFLQWKGTDVCMDVYCKCGCHSHIDDYFVYNIQCPSCGTVYRCTPYIEFIELTNPPLDVKVGEIIE